MPEEVLKLSDSSTCNGSSIIRGQYATERRIEAIAECVAAGELPDASLEFCSAMPFVEEGLKVAGTAPELTERRTSVAALKVDRRGRHRKAHKMAPVDEGTYILHLSLCVHNYTSL